MNAIHHPLDYMLSELDKIETSMQHHIHCAGGYRSVIAISLLMQHGYTDLVNVEGGYDAIKETSAARSEFVCPSTL